MRDIKKYLVARRATLVHFIINVTEKRRIYRTVKKKKEKKKKGVSKLQ